MGQVANCEVLPAEIRQTFDCSRVVAFRPRTLHGIIRAQKRHCCIFCIHADTSSAELGTPSGPHYAYLTHPSAH